MKSVLVFALVCFIGPGFLIALPTNQDTDDIIVLEDDPEPIIVDQPAMIPLIKLTPAMNVEESTANPVNCLICKRVAKWIMKELEDNKTEVSVVQALDQVCDRIFSAGKSLDCKEFVSRYTHEIIQLIIQEDDPKTVCRLLNVCGARVDQTQQESNCNGCIESTDTFLKLFPLVSHPNRSSSAPLLLIYLCESGEVEGDCIQFMENHIETITPILKSNPNSRQICNAIDMCPKPQEVPIQTEVEETQSHVQSLPTCFVCKRIVKWVNEQIKENRTEAAIEAALRDVCHFLRDIDNCHERVADWSEKLIKVLKTATDSEIACDLMAVCGFPSSVEREQEEIIIVNQEDTPTTTPPSTVSTACHECQNIAHYIQARLNDYKTEKELDDFVIERICDQITQESIRETCTSFVNEYGPAVMQMIALKAFDPKIVCETELRICPRSLDTSSQEENEQEFEILPPTSQRTCDVCVNTVKELDSLLAVEQIDKDISKVAARVCSRVPVDRQKQVRQV